MLNDSLSDYYTKNEVDTKLSKAGKKSAIVILSQTINTYVYSSMIPLDNATKYNITITGITIAWVGKVSDLSGIIIRKANDGWYFETTNTELTNKTAYACIVSYTVS